MQQGRVDKDTSCWILCALDTHGFALFMFAMCIPWSGVFRSLMLPPPCMFRGFDTSVDPSSPHPLPTPCKPPLTPCFCVPSRCQSDGQFKKTACNDLLKKKNPDFKFTPMQEGIKAVSPPSVTSHEV